MANIFGIIGKGLEAASEPILSGTMLRAQLEREKMIATKELDQLKLRSTLQQELMRAEQGELANREKALAGIQQENALALQAEKSRNDIMLEKEKADLEQKTQAKHYEAAKKLISLATGDKIEEYNPAMVIQLMQQLDETGMVPEAMLGQGLGFRMALTNNPEGLKQGLGHIKREGQSLMGGTKTTQTTKMGISGKGEFTYEQSVQEAEREQPKTFEAYLVSQVEQGVIDLTTAQKLFKTARTSKEEFQEYVYDLLRKQPELLNTDFGKSLATAAGAAAYTSPTTKETAETTVQTRDEAIQRTAERIDKIRNRYARSIEAAIDAGDEPLVRSLESQRNKEITDQEGFWNREYSRFGVFPKELLPSAAEESTGKPGSIPDVKSLKKMIHQ